MSFCVYLFVFVVISFSCAVYFGWKSLHKSFEQRIAEINVRFGTQFNSDPLLGWDGWGFLFDEQQQKICFCMGSEKQLLDFDYISSWEAMHADKPGFIFMTEDTSRPMIMLNVASHADMAAWRRKLVELLPARIPVALAA